MINYDYLEWGTNVTPDEEAKRLDYKELEKMNFFETGAENVLVDEENVENNEYNVWFLDNIKEKPWGDKNTDREERRDSIKKQIADFVKEVKPGHKDWEWRGGYFIDAFLLEDVENGCDSKYDSVLLLAPDPEKASPLAIVWEMIPEDKRMPLMNLRRCGMKIYAAFSDHFNFMDEGFMCIEIYLKK